jgi:hypothetical protein
MTLFVDKLLFISSSMESVCSTGSAINRTHTHPDMMVVVGWFPRATKNHFSIKSKLCTMQQEQRTFTYFRNNGLGSCHGFVRLKPCDTTMTEDCWVYWSHVSPKPNKERLKRSNYVSDVLCFTMIMTTTLMMMTVTSCIGVRTKVSLKTRQITVSKEQ